MKNLVFLFVTILSSNAFADDCHIMLQALQQKAQVLQQRAMMYKQESQQVQQKVQQCIFETDITQIDDNKDICGSQKASIKVAELNAKAKFYEENSVVGQATAQGVCR